MANYVGYVYYADGTKKVVVKTNSERSAEGQTAQAYQFEIKIWERAGAKPFFKPTRYDVKEEK